MTAEEYRNYLETDFDDVDLKELKDIRKIRIDRNHTCLLYTSDAADEL